MSEIITGVIGVCVTLGLGLWAAFKLLLPHVMDAISRQIEHIRQQEIKELDARLQLHSRALFTSVEIGSRIAESYRNRSIEAADKLWQDAMQIGKKFAPLVALEAVLTEQELNNAVRNLESENENVREVLREYSSSRLAMNKLIRGDEEEVPGIVLAIGMGSHRDHLHETRIFVTDRLWKIHSILINVHGRLGYLVSKGIEEGKPVNWRDDSYMQGLFVDVLELSVWTEIKEMEFSGFRVLIGLLEQEFILEAKKTMRGSEQLAESVTEVSGITEEAEIRARYWRDSLYYDPGGTQWQGASRNP